MQPRQFSRGMFREDAKGEQLPRFFRHRTVIEGCEVAQNRSLGIAQRHSQKAFDSPLARVRIVREFLAYSRGVVAQIPVNHLFTRRSRQSPLEISSDVVPVPEGDGTRLGVGLGRCELCNEGPARVRHTGQDTNECLEILFAIAVRVRLDDHTQRGDFFGTFAERTVGGFRRRRPRSRPIGEYLVRLDHSHLPDGKTAIAARVAVDFGPACRFAGHSAGLSFYSFSIGNWKHRTKRPGRSTAGSRGGPTKCRQFSREIVGSWRC